MQTFNRELLKKAIFKWQDLNGKELKIFVENNDEALVVLGYEEKSKKTYLLHSETKA